MEPVIVRLLGKNALMVFGKWMLPGETRQLHPRQVEQLEAAYPGRFARVGAIEERAEAILAEPEPVVEENPIEEVETPEDGEGAEPAPTVSAETEPEAPGEPIEEAPAVKVTKSRAKK